MKNSLIRCLIYVIISCHMSRSFTRGDNPEFFVLEEQPVGEFVGNIRISDANNYEYSILERRYSSMFRVDRLSGVIVTSSVLDREGLCDVKTDDCRMTVTIYANSANVFKTFPVLIHLVDISDNAPTFPTASFRITVSESSLIGATFRVPAAEHNDSSRFSTMSYNISPSSVPFSLELTRYNTHIILKLTRSLDREILDRYQFKILATDSGSPPSTAFLSVIASVTDVNDNPPKFSHNLYNITVAENAPLDSVVYSVYATDPDVGTNSEIVYSFRETSDSNPFAINASNGVVTVNEKIDREVKDEYKLSVVAHDGGARSLTSQCPFIVIVSDVNDNAPVMNFHFPFSDNVSYVLENASLNAFVIHATIYDPDRINEGTVNCTSTSDWFSVRWLYENEYEIVLARTLDREKTDFYNLTITCLDSLDPSMSSSAVLPVIAVDVNDNPPLFNSSDYTLNIVENNDETSRFIAKISAEDADIGANALIFYTLSIDADGAFVINRTSGVITALKPLDYEKKSSYTFVVTAKNLRPSLFESSATVTVKLIDINDEYPVFHGPTDFSIDEEKAKNSFVGVVNATDADVGPPGVLHFFLIGNETGFKINTVTGLLTSNVVFNREEISFYTITIGVADTRSATQLRTATYTVHISDVNDHSPLFTFPSHENNTVTIVGGRDQGSYITTLQAVDPDIGDNGRVLYGVITSDAALFFSVDKYTGDVRITRAISIGNTTRTFRVLVNAKDAGVPYRQNQAWLYVTFHASDAEELGDSQNNVTIVAAVLGATFVLCVIIIGTICAIRRRNLDEIYGGGDIKRSTITSNLDVRDGNNSIARNSRRKSRRQKLEFPLGQADDDNFMRSNVLRMENVNTVAKDTASSEASTETSFAKFDDSGSVVTYDSGKGASELDTSGRVYTVVFDDDAFGRQKIPPDFV